MDTTGITMMEFSEKYGIPYRIVYDAHWACWCYNETSGRKNQKYDEQALLHEVRVIIQGNLKKLNDQADKLAGYMAMLDGNG